MLCKWFKMNLEHFTWDFSMLSGFVTISSGIIAAVLSDSMRTWIGKRKPIIIVSIILATVSMVLRCLIPLSKGSTGTIVLYTFVYLIGSVAFGGISSVFRSFLIDICHPSLMGMASAYLGLTVVLGAVIGGNVFNLFFSLVSQWVPVIIVIALNLPAAILVMFCREPDHHYSKGIVSFRHLKKPSSPSSAVETTDSSTVSIQNNEEDDIVPISTLSQKLQILKTNLRTILITENPLLHWNFCCLFISRLLLNSALFSYGSYLIYYFYDSFQVNYRIFIWDHFIDNAIQASGVFGTVSSLFSLICGLLCGILHDKIGCKTLAICGNLSLVIGLIGLAIIRNFSAALCCAIFLGIGSGTYYSGM
jgi:MFS family permease